MKMKINLLISTLLLSGILTFAASTPPAITLQPVSLVVAAGNTVVLSVTAIGINLQYQWTYNGDVLPGATAASLTLTNLSDQTAGAYQAIVSNNGGSTISDVAEVSIAVPAAGFADNFASRGSITNALGLMYGSSNGATKESGEPQPCNGRVKNSVWLSWTAPTNGVATFATIGSTFDTILGVYTGTTVSALSEVAVDDDLGGYHTSFVTFNATANTKYQIYVGSLDADGGDILFGWMLNSNVQPLPTILSKPTDLTVLPGAAASLCVQYQSSAPVTIQWYHNDQPIPGANQPCLQWTQLTVADLGKYQVVFSSPNWTWELKPVEIQFNSEGLTTVAARNKLVYSINSSLVGK